jgi:hypothetical protein
MRQGLTLVGMGAQSLTVNDSCKEHRICFDEFMIASHWFSTVGDWQMTQE